MNIIRLYNINYGIKQNKIYLETRMHSSRMRTGRSLTVFRSLQPGGCTWSGGVYLVWGGVPGPRGGYLVRGELYLVTGGVPGPRGCTRSRGVPGPGGGCTWSRGVYLVRYSPPCEQNDKQV